ncbi:MAG TPA: hypothetical protein VF980_05535 [Thermoanaerobaculia bacterium]
MRRRADIASAALLAAGTAAVVLWQNSRLAVLWDVSYVLENASRIAAGQVPYRDFPFPYAPLTFMMQAAIIRLFGHHYALHIAYAAIAGAAATALTYAIVRLLGCRPLAAVLLCAPLTFLGIYCIFPHPFYDPDTCLSILVSILLLLTARSPRARFAAGFISVVPLFVKQNIGLAFVGAVALVLLIARNWAALAGAATAFATALLLIGSIAGLRNYVHWTIVYAAERRWPPLAQYLSMFDDSTLWWWIAVVIAGALVARRWRLPGTLIAMTPWIWSAVEFFVTDDLLEREENFLRFWPLLIVCAVSLCATRRPNRLPILVVLAAIAGAFLSQQVWGSTYGIWPLFVIVAAFAFDDTVLAAAIIAGVTLLHAVPYIVDSNRLTYAKVHDGALQHASIAPLRGLSMRGPWIADFEELVAWTGRNIPRNDAILSIPGEDLFYFTTGRVPRVPALMFDTTINPYSAPQLAAMAAQRHVRWVIVKRTIQAVAPPTGDLPQLLGLLRAHLRLVAHLRNYDIYQFV